MIGNPEVLYRAMRGLDRAGAQRHASACNEAMLQGNITTLTRAQYYLAQIASESVDLRYFEEINGRNQRYAPYYGRGPIQLTWESNYRDFGRWCKARNLVTDSEVFVRHPSRVAEPKWGWLASVYYWQTRNLNHWCDHGNFRELTRRINGAATWGFPSHYGERLKRLAYVKRLGKKVLPGNPDRLTLLTDTERDTVRRLLKIRAAAADDGWTEDRKRQANRLKAFIRAVLMPRIRAFARATGWEKANRRERHDILGDAYGPPLRDNK